VKNDPDALEKLAEAQAMILASADKLASFAMPKVRKK